ncbi:ABC transporter ATP-binding protein [Paenibacillus camelliae]|uniref:ABC transporter ATP-binding protein n=1 Tax=Paenibacillus camelliae TaxID=512410 RepID=UPI00204181DC|nr:ABC transporter ATP-binding protein [Paenibacillus camelliae]MCM3632716.1 ABC transporter ATP-binding protein/permease [Paenibacillus camelliae]
MVDELPEIFKSQLSEDILFNVKTDLDTQGMLAAQWLAITHGDVTLWQEKAEPIKRIGIEEIKEARAVSNIGSGMLVVETTTNGPIVIARYTSTLSTAMSFAAKLITALAQGEQLPVATKGDIPRYCSTCHSPMKEGTKTCEFCLSKKYAALRMLGYLKPYKFKGILALGLLILSTIVELIPPFLTKIIVDDVLQPQQPGTLFVIIIAAWALTLLVMSSMQALRGYIGVAISSKLMGDIRKDVYQSLMKLSLAYFDRRQTSQFISRVNSDAESMRQFMTDGVIYIAGHLLRFLFILVIIFSMNWKLTLLALVPIPLLVFLSISIWPKVGRRLYQQWRAIFRLNMQVGDTLQGIRVIKAFGQEKSELVRYNNANEEVVHHDMRSEKMWQLFFPAFGLLTSLGAVLIWYLGGYQVLSNELQLGVLLAFVAYLGMLFGPIQWLSQMISWTSRAMTASHRIFEIMDTPADVADHPDAVKVPNIKGDVVLQQVTYGYEKHYPVLKDINLEVKAGEMIGLVGHSGAGKSTFINLLCRFYDVDEGVITIDGVPIRDIEQTELRRQIGVVLQETFLFDGTIAENIAYSKPDATPEDIMRAAKIANAHDFIVRLPDGYDTRVGERGHKLSGGEKQRVAIARAIIHDPKILILDEATASVDTETERQIQEALANLVKGRTTFAIAHRLSTLRNADRLVVLDRGKMVELGTHEELLEKEDGVYRKLVDAQMEMSKIKGVGS